MASGQPRLVISPPSQYEKACGHEGKEMVEVDPGVGMRLADADDWRVAPRVSLLDAFGPAPKEKRARRPTIPQIEKESGRIVTSLTVAPDGTRTYWLCEKADAPVVNPWDSIYETAQKRPS
jgi:hypothetical protein